MNKKEAGKLGGLAWSEASKIRYSKAPKLCKECGAVLLYTVQPTYKALNKGKGLYGRLQRYKAGKSY